MHIFTLECEQMRPIERLIISAMRTNMHNVETMYQPISDLAHKKSRFFGKLSFFTFVLSDAFHNVNPSVIGQKSTGKRYISLVGPIIHHNQRLHHGDNGPDQDISSWSPCPRPVSPPQPGNWGSSCRHCHLTICPNQPAQKRTKNHPSITIIVKIKE